jgi:hypothetical protein
VTYTPDIRAYQQLQFGGPTGPFDCTAWSGALLVDAHSQGAIKTTGRAIRLRTDEAVPDRSSPGLNLPQVDEAVLEITTARGKPVDLDTRVQLRSLSRADVQFRIVDGRWATIQVLRDVLVRRGFLDGFRGGHALTVHTLIGQPDVFILGDPLVDHYVRCSPDALFDAAEALTGGHIYAQFTRDLTPDYHVRIPNGTEFARFHLDSAGRIARVSRHVSHNAAWQRCTPPRYHASAPGKPKGWARQLVQITEPGSNRNGWFVSAKYAQEIVP